MPSLPFDKTRLLAYAMEAGESLRQVGLRYLATRYTEGADPAEAVLGLSVALSALQTRLHVAFEALQATNTNEDLMWLLGVEPPDAQAMSEFAQAVQELERAKDPPPSI